MNDDKLESMFEEFLSLYKVINRKSIIEILNAEINTQQLIEVYQLSDGIRSTREISRIIINKCSHATVANLWNKWALIGLVTPTDQKGRYKATFDLYEYGINKIDEEY